jgi:hypothetical protein
MNVGQDVGQGVGQEENLTYTFERITGNIMQEKTKGRSRQKKLFYQTRYIFI